MYEIERMIEGYKERLNEIIDDIGQLQYQLTEKLKSKQNLEKFIKRLEREDDKICQQ